VTFDTRLDFLVHTMHGGGSEIAAALVHVVPLLWRALPRGHVLGEHQTRRPLA
jgi:hypothetical protein